jgi:hypothetical protein
MRVYNHYHTSVHQQNALLEALMGSNSPSKTLSDLGTFSASLAVF